MLAVVVHDRTLVERTQQRLRSEQELFRTLFANAPVPIREEDFSGVGDWFVELRAKGVADLEAYIDTHEDEFIDAIMKIRTVRVNPAFVRLMQAEEEKELLAGFQSAEFSRGTLDSFRRQFVAFWDGGDYHEAEFVGYDRKGEPFECFVTVSVQRTETGLDLSRVIAAFLDLTEIRSNQRSLERLISDKDQFIASVSHELRTPLASVLGLSDELHHHWDRFSTDEIRQLIGIIFDQSGDLASLVEDLLVAAKTEMGSLSIHPERVDVAGLVDESITELVASGTLSAPISVTGRARAAHADPVRVRQIIRNLVTNAVRYGGDHVWIEMGRDDLPYLRVIDDGDGIPVEERDRIFDPYHRATGPDAKLGALGLGLTISRQLARMMDGDLSYDYQDGESIFTVTLPGAR
jgi:signal transduction histidine kinase